MRIFLYLNGDAKIGKLKMNVIKLRKTEYTSKESKYSEKQKGEKIKRNYRFELIKRCQKQILKNFMACIVKNNSRQLRITCSR